MTTTNPFDTLPIARDAAWEHSPTVSRATRLVTLAAVVLPLLGFVAAIVLLWGTAFSWVYAALLAGMYIATGFGITVGFHRLFTHCAFRTNRVVAFVLAVLGSMAVQGPLLTWVAVHRRHHQHSDDVDDPHSPHQHGDTFMGSLRGVWHAHTGWLFQSAPADLPRYIKDLRADRMLTMVSSLFPVWVLAGLIIPAVLGGVITQSWTGVFLGFLWGGLARVFLGHHVTWSINSVCHIWGQRPFESHDESRNNAIFGLLAFGEGWHNNHHAFPTSARHGLAWWQIDTSYYLVRIMGWLRLAHDIRVPTPERMAAKRRQHSESVRQE